ncbi:MAG: type II CAAX endopeptidase family protein [Pseudomonadota bacterium]
MDTNQSARGAGVATFLALTVAISSIFYAPIILTGNVAGAGGLYVAGLMWSPGIAAILTTILRRDDFAAFGWGWGDWRWNLRAYLIPSGYAAAAYLGVWLTGLGTFAPPESVAAIGGKLGWSGLPAAFVVAGYVALAATAGMVHGTAFALGEEIGWRGFLAPRLMRRFGFVAGTIVTALIWAAWHVPILLFADYNGGTPWWYSLSCFTLLVLGSSFTLSWIRLRSNSVWPCAILHASHNLFIQTIFNPLTGPSGAVTPYAIGEFGFALVVTLGGVAIWCIAHRPDPAHA